MNKKIKKLWVEALRSGEYKQGKYKLRSIDDKFCVLGVLCNLHAQKHPEIAAQENKKHKYMGHDADLPSAVADWAGLGDVGGGKVTIGKRKRELWYFNDNGVSFAKLADAIEKQL